MAFIKVPHHATPPDLVKWLDRLGDTPEIVIAHLSVSDTGKPAHSYNDVAVIANDDEAKSAIVSTASDYVGYIRLSPQGGKTRKQLTWHSIEGYAHAAAIDITCPTCRLLTGMLEAVFTRQVTLLDSLNSTGETYAKFLEQVLQLVTNVVHKGESMLDMSKLDTLEDTERSRIIDAMEGIVTKIGGQLVDGKARSNTSDRASPNLAIRRDVIKALGDKRVREIIQQDDDLLGLYITDVEDVAAERVEALKGKRAVLAGFLQPDEITKVVKLFA